MAGREMLNVDALPAASVILLRDAPLEVLMILRHEKASFVPSAWVFPGGAVDPEDGPAGSLDAARAAAAREVFEETGITIAGDDLVATSRWITPKALPKRFDTWFFLGEVPRDVSVTLHEAEAVDWTWITPSDALSRWKSGSFPMVFPTVKNLEAIAHATSARELIESRRGADIAPVEPIMVNNRPALP